MVDAGRNARPDRSAIPTLVGRQQEAETLQRAWQQALNGNGGLVLVSGEAGIGKTRLVQTIQFRASEEGALALAGAAYDLSATPPYGPWLEVSARYPSDPAVPDLPAALEHGPGAGEAQSQSRLFELIRDFFVSVSEARPLLLTLEDLHWSDRASLDLLRYLARQLEGHRILVIATYREEEITRRHPLFQLLPALVRESQPVRIDLRPLQEDDIRNLVARRVDLSDVERSRLASYLFQRADGNPLFTEELLRTLEHDGALRQTESGWLLDELSHVAVPDLIQQLVERRMSAMSDISYRALQAAAVIGQNVPFVLWESISGADSVATASTEALERKLAAESHDGQGISFTHALVREAIYEGLSLPERRNVHGAVAGAYLELADPEPDPVAYHLQQAGDSRAVEWLVRAGEQAEANLAYREACERYESAAGILRSGTGEQQTLVGLLLKSGFLLHQFDPDLSTRQFHLARQVALDAGELSAAGYALVCSGANRTIVGEPRRGLQEQRDGIDEMMNSSLEMDPAILWGIPVASTGYEALQIASNGLAYALATHGRLQEAIQRAERYLDVDWRNATDEKRLTEIASRTTNHFQAYHGLAVALSNLGYVEDSRLALRLIEEIFRIVKPHHPIRLQMVMSWFLRQHFPYSMDDLDERKRLVSRAEELFEEYTTTLDPVSASSVYELHLLYSGKWSELRSVKESGKVSPLSPWWTISMSARARLELHQGNFEAARGIVEELLPDGPQTEPDDYPHSLPGYQVRIAAELELETGNLTAAREWMNTHDRWLDWSGALLGRSEALLLRGRLHLAEDDIETAFDYAQRALSRASNPRQPMALIPIHRFLGDLYTRSEDFDAAEHHLRRSYELAHASQMPFEQALTLLSHAELNTDRNEPEEASNLLSAARRIASDLAAQPVLDRAAKLNVRLRAPTGSSPLGLSRRELEVLHLLVQGKTDREIADELFISRHTVMRHVSSILRKLDVDSRTAAVAFVVSQNLI